jgi:CubicO group peptidase (beta-lactamase class C family)
MTLSHVDGSTEFYYPRSGGGIDSQELATPDSVDLRSNVIQALQGSADRWALWRNGRLVHVEGDLAKTVEVKSLRKTWHAMTVGAFIQDGLISSIHDPIGRWCPELKGLHARATWWHVLTQSSGFDYPHGDYSDFEPGEIWTYSDKNPHHLCNALARVHGLDGYAEGYDAVVKAAYFDTIALSGWESSVREDGIRFHFSLEHMGRLGMLALTRGKWQGVQIIPADFIEMLETKQTAGIKVNYNGPDDGKVDLDEEHFPESPYGLMTWVNSASDHYPDADTAWAWASGAGGTYVLWNHRFGIVFAAVGRAEAKPPIQKGIPNIIESHLKG